MNTNTITNIDANGIALRPLPATTIAWLHKITSDPIDAMRLTADVYAITAYGLEQRLARHSGKPTPPFPRPQSKFLRGFISHFKTWLAAMATELRPDEMERLIRIGTAYVGRVKDDPELLGDELFSVVTMAPPFALLWLRAHFDEIEAKVAS